jgi:malic enzyme
MKPYRIEPRRDGGLRLRVSARGAALLTDPILNKSTAFSPEERRAFGLRGLLPHHVSTLEEQVRRAYGNIVRKTDPLERYIGLAALQDRNETLFYRVLAEHIEELAPIVYTPTVGQACREFSRIFRRPRGVWITPDDAGHVDDVLAHAPFDDVRLIVVTDNERILGLGDQGAGGIGIPIGKLVLYTVAAGIHPAHTLPVSLDVGTDNRALLDDPLYLGWREPRLRGARYHALVEELVQAVRQRFPRALLQWEDFKKGNAFALLDRYRAVLPSFNDDIQGTAAVAVAGAAAAARITGVPLAAQRFVILGAGAAGIGIARQIRATLVRAGVDAHARARAIAVLDSRGLLVEGDDVEAYKRELAWPRALVAELGMDATHPIDLAAAVRALAPHVLIGTSGQPGVFGEALVRDLASRVERPVIMPFSNPTSQSEATPADLVRWTDGRALVATGSPFEPVVWQGRTLRIGQGNNVFVFPGVGLGALVAEARVVTDEMFVAAADALAEEVSEADLADGALYPRLRGLRRITAHVAAAVVRAAREAGAGRKLADEEIPGAVAAAMWTPEYPELVPEGGARGPGQV